VWVSTYCNVGVIPATEYGLASLLGVAASNGAGVVGNANGVELWWGVGIDGVCIEGVCIAGVAIEGVAILNPDIMIRKKVEEKVVFFFFFFLWK
jgi:hypothetical protein